VIRHVFVNLADGRPLFDETEYVNCHHFLVGKVRISVIALPLCYRSEPSAVSLSDEQVDPNKRRGSIHVAKGGSLEVLDASP